MQKMWHMGILLVNPRANTPSLHVQHSAELSHVSRKLHGHEYPAENKADNHHE